MWYRDRRAAGRELARLLAPYAERSDVVVLALPRGGVPVAYEIARALAAPLDIFIVRKLGLPGQDELAMGAIASGGVRVLSRNVIEALRIPASVVEAVTARERRELERREKLYRNGRRSVELTGKLVILVDDGLATGSTMRAAVAAVRKFSPFRVVVAVPVASVAACEDFKADVDECICGTTPEPFYGVGYWYGDFSQTDDEEVHELLERASGAEAARATNSSALSL